MEVNGRKREAGVDFISYLCDELVCARSIRTPGQSETGDFAVEKVTEECVGYPMMVRLYIILIYPSSAVKGVLRHRLAMGLASGHRPEASAQLLAAQRQRILQADRQTSCIAPWRFAAKERQHSRASIPACLRLRGCL